MIYFNLDETLVLLMASVKVPLLMLAGTLRLQSKVVVWGLSSVMFMVSSRHKPHSPEREIKSCEGGVQLPTWRGI